MRPQDRTILIKLADTNTVTLRSTDCKFPDDGLVKPKLVEAFVLYFNVNLHVLTQIYCALVGVIKDWGVRGSAVG